MTIRLSRALSERAVGKDDAVHVLNREVLPVLKELVRTLSAPVAAFTWVDAVVALDVSRGSLFAASVALSENSEVQLDNTYSGAQGLIFVRQDAVGGWELTFTSPLRTIVRVDPEADDFPNLDPESITLYRYVCFEVDGLPYILLEKIYLL